MNINYISQEETNGCAIACLAMIMQKSYNEVANSLEVNNKGLDWMEVDRYLANNGYAVARKWKYDCTVKQNAIEWPPKPFGDIHLVQVMTKNNTIHMIILLQNGTVLDPANRELINLNDYAKVDYIAAIVPVFK